MHWEQFEDANPSRVPEKRYMDFHSHSLLTKLGFAALMGNSALAIYRSRDDPRAVAFVAGAYGGIVLLFHFLRRFERGEGAGRVIMDALYCVLAKVGFAVLRLPAPDIYPHLAGRYSVKKSSQRCPLYGPQVAPIRYT
jgi:hypothetical protein